MIDAKRCPICLQDEDGGCGCPPPLRLEPPDAWRATFDHAPECPDCSRIQPGITTNECGCGGGVTIEPSMPSQTQYKAVINYWWPRLGYESANAMVYPALRDRRAQPAPALVESRQAFRLLKQALRLISECGNLTGDWPRPQTGWERWAAQVDALLKDEPEVQR